MKHDASSDGGSRVRGGEAVPRRRRSPPARLVRVPGDFVVLLGRLRALAAKLEEAADALLFEIAEPRHVDRRDDAPAPTPNPPGHPARTWVTALSVTEHPGGALLVVANGRKFRLQPHLASLFLALAEDTGPSRDGGVAFKSLGDLAKRLGARGGMLSNDTVNKYVFRLRRLLAERAGLPPTVIETNARLGRRLAVTREVAAQALGDARAAGLLSRPADR